MTDKLLTADDLIAAKKHDTFHNEVISGRAGGVAGGAAIDYATNAVTNQTQKTLTKTVDDIDWTYKGLFTGTVEFTKSTDYAVDGDGVAWVYIGANPYPFSVTGITPNETDYKQIVVFDKSEIGEAVTKGQEELTGLSIFPSDGSNAQAEDIISSSISTIKFNNLLNRIAANDGSKATVSGEITAINSTSMTVDGVNYRLFPKSAERRFYSLSDAMDESVYGFDGDVVELIGVIQSGVGQSLWMRDYTEDDITKASTSWLTETGGVIRGLVNNKILWFGPNGEAYRYFRKNPKLTELGAVDGADISQIKDVPIEWLKANGNWLTVDIDILNCSSSTPFPQLNSSFDVIKLTSSLGLATGHFQIKFTCNTPVIQYSGGSGSLAGTCVSNLRFLSSNSGILINKGFCGAHFDNCEFLCAGHPFAQLSNNIGGGTFTENFIIMNSHITCTRIFEFERGAGNDSFHGCGYINCWINVDNSDGALNVLGNGSETGRLVWYNAPVSGTIWNSNTDPVFFCKNNAVGQPNQNTLYGEIVTESSGTILMSDAGITTMLACDIMELTKTIALNGALLVSEGGFRTNGATAFVGKPFAVHYVKPAGVDTFILRNQMDRGTSKVSLYASTNYWEQGYTYELTASTSSNLDLLIQNINNTRNFNQAEYGGLTFTSVGNGSNDYIVTNPHWTNVEVGIVVFYNSVGSQLTSFPTIELTQYTA